MWEGFAEWLAKGRTRFEKDDSFTLRPSIMRFLFVSDLRQSGFDKTEVADRITM